MGIIILALAALSACETNEAHKEEAGFGACGPDANPCARRNVSLRPAAATRQGPLSDGTLLFLGILVMGHASERAIGLARVCIMADRNLLGGRFI